jgi:hypothetical protein
MRLDHFGSIEELQAAFQDGTVSSYCEISTRRVISRLIFGNPTVTVWANR